MYAEQQQQNNINSQNYVAVAKITLIFFQTEKVGEKLYQQFQSTVISCSLPSS